MATTTARAHCATHFSLREARAIVRDLFTPNAVIYWSDFLLSAGVGLLCFRLVQRRLEFPSLLQTVVFFISCLALYRAALFTHELTHLRKGTFTGFRTAWNLLIGIPFLMPSFLYYTHLAHHARKHYGTDDDGEYLPLAAGPVAGIFRYFGQVPLIPLLAVLRFLVLVPLCWISPSVRRWVQQRASSMVIDPSYVRPLPPPSELRIWRLQETACFLYVATVAALLVAGVLPWTFLAQAWLTALVILTLNQLRTAGAHRFRHHGERELSFVDQLLDSLNYPTNPLFNSLWAPVGLRYHALHHLFPSLPYHNLGEAHRRLMERLPADSAYRQTNCPSLWSALRDLFRSAQQHAPAPAKRLPPSAHRA